MDTLEQEIFFDPAAVAAQAEGEWEDMQITVQAVKKATGTNQKGPWTRTGVQDQDGNWHGQFKDLDVVEGGVYEIETEQNGNFSNIKSITPVTTTSNGTAPAAGGPNWDEIGFRKTLSQQLAAVFGTDAAVTALLSADDSQRIQYAAHLATVAHNNAIKVVTVEVPKPVTSDDVPF